MSDETVEGVEEIASKELEDSQTLDERFAELENELADARDAQLRAIADFQNYKRRSLEEAVRTRELATAALVEKLLPLLDNFSRSITAAEAGSDPQAVLDGVRLMERQLRAALSDVNVKSVAEVGQQFDPTYHEAVASEISDAPEGSVLEVLEQGFTMGSKLLRPAKVRVSMGPAE
jgi:molecular chaperone GrpE